MLTIDDPSHWRNRADEAPSAALKMADPQARETMLVMAANCEWLAKLIEGRRAAIPTDFSMRREQA
jgi:hypothetical protein